MIWDGFNQRKFPRLNVRCEISLHPQPDADSMPTQTENIGAGGVCVILPRALERFSRCWIRLGLDDHLPSVDCQGRIVWAVPTQAQAGARKKTFDTGVEFVDIDPSVRELIRRFVDSKMAEIKPAPAAQ